MSEICPACRTRKQAGFLYAIVGAQIINPSDAPPLISWPRICKACGYQDELGPPANPMPAITAWNTRKEPT